jgi:hypothetical protein
MWFRGSDCTDDTETSGGITGISVFEKIYFPWRSIVRIKWENVQMYIKMQTK